MLPIPSNNVTNASMLRELDLRFQLLEMKLDLLAAGALTSKPVETPAIQTGQGRQNALKALASGGAE